MPTFLSQKILSSNLLSLVLAMFPASFIAGNMIINLNLLIIVLLTVFIYKKEIVNIELFFLDKLFISFFSLIILSGFINDFKFFTNDLEWKGYFSTIIKSISFLRYLIFYFIIRFLIEQNKITLKFFFISCAICSLFVSFDIFYQLFFGKDIFGFVATGRKLSGPFGDELIAGSFLQRFSIFSFFLLSIFFTIRNNKYLKFYFVLLFIIFFFAIIFSGNRMPLVLFVLAIFSILIFKKNIRKYFFSLLIALIVIFSIAFNFNAKVNINFSVFYNQLHNTILVITNSLNNNEKNYSAPQHLKEFYSFYHTWQINKYIGGGIKNFRYYCHIRDMGDTNSPFYHEQGCNMHPHNYYLEILTETGLFGFFLFLFIVFNITKISLFRNKIIYFSFLNNNLKFMPFFILFFIEIFPIKSTGSFFTTGNSTYLFLLMGVLIALVRKDNSIEKIR